MQAVYPQMRCRRRWHPVWGYSVKITGHLRYLEIKENGVNTSSFPKFEISKLIPKSQTLSHSQTERFSFRFPLNLFHQTKIMID